MDTQIINNKLLEISPTGMVIMNSAGEITYANREAEKSLGLTKTEISTLSYNSPEWKITDFRGNPVADDNLPFSLARDRNEAVLNIEHTIELSSDQKIYLSVNASPITDDEGKFDGVIATFENWTSRIIAERKLKESEEKLLKAQALSHLGSWEYFFETDTVTWSKELFNIFERPHELEAPRYSEQRPFYTSESYEKMDRAVQACVNDEVPYELELEIITSSGSVRQIISKGDVKKDAEGQIIGCYGTAQDITDRKKLECDLLSAKQRAEESEARYRGLLTNLETGVVVHSSDSTIIECNSRSCQLLRLTEQQMKGKVALDPYWKFVDEDGKPLPVDQYPVMRIIKTKESIRNLTIGVERAESEIIWLEGNGFPVLNESGEIVEVIISFIDITKNKQAEESLLIAKERAEESDRLKTAFLQNISHEIRTPLNAICGFSQILDQQNPSEQQRKNYISLIQSNSDQLLAIISDILAVSNLETDQEKIKVSEVVINDTLTQIMSIFSERALTNEVNFTIRKELQDQFSIIKTDERKFRQIVTNLLTNAFKFTNSGEIEFGYKVKNDFLEFFVKDTGIGIDPKFHKKIFERFSQANSTITDNYGGTGLGLSISKGYAEMLGGEIWVESAPGMGSTFYFTIPYKPVYQKAAIDASSVFSILIAEDEDINFLVMKGLLRDVPATLIHVKNGQEAVDAVKTNPDIGLVLMDIKMPVMRGDEAAKIIKLFKKDLPIIAQSGYALEQERARFDEIFDEYLTKPIDGNLLVRKVMDHLGIEKSK